MIELIQDNMKFVAVFLGIFAGFPIVWNRRKQLGQTKARQTAITCALFSIYSTLSALLFAGMESWMAGDGFRFGDISTYGVYFICPLFLAAYAKLTGQNMRSIFDVFALYAMPSLFLMRVNCLISGCCGGKVISGTSWHWSTRQAEMLFYILMLAFLIYREKNGALRGTAFPLLMICYGSFRFLTEGFREIPGAGRIHLAHTWSLIAIAIGFSIYFELKNQDNKIEVRKKRSKK